MVNRPRREEATCARCKRLTPLYELKALWRPATKALSLVGVLSEDEADKHYCPTCRAILDMGVAFLAVVGVIGALLLWLLDLGEWIGWFN